MIKEYFRWQAERCDNGGIVKGQHVNDDVTGKYWIILSINESQEIDGGLRLFCVEIKPETLKRVAVKPVKVYDDYEKQDRYKCPNCNHYIPTGVHNCNWNGCGMALDWNE